jgi:hypothetical protein
MDRLLPGTPCLHQTDENALADPAAPLDTSIGISRPSASRAPGTAILGHRRPCRKYAPRAAGPALELPYGADKVGDEHWPPNHRDTEGASLLQDPTCQLNLGPMHDLSTS